MASTRNRPRVHARDHEHGGADPSSIHYEDVGDTGDTGGGTGIFFDTDPQAGGFLKVTATDTGSTWADGKILFQVPNGAFRVQSEGIYLANQGGSGTGATITINDLGDVGITAAGELALVVAGGALIRLIGLPTSDPGVAGAVWNDGGTLKISP